MLGRLLAALALVLLPGCIGLRSPSPQTIAASSFTGEARKIELAVLREALIYDFKNLNSPRCIALITTADRLAEIRVKSSLAPLPHVEAVESIQRIRSGKYRSGDRGFDSFFKVGSIIMEGSSSANVYIENPEGYAWLPARKEGGTWKVEYRGMVVP
jgi:hypothetical protein